MKSEIWGSFFWALVGFESLLLARLGLPSWLIHQEDEDEKMSSKKLIWFFEAGELVQPLGTNPCNTGVAMSSS
jgi:hypothetical protein